MMLKSLIKKKVHVSFIATPGDVNIEKYVGLIKDSLHPSKSPSLTLIGENIYSPSTLNFPCLKWGWLWSLNKYIKKRVLTYLHQYCLLFLSKNKIIRWMKRRGLSLFYKCGYENLEVNKWYDFPKLNL